MLPQGSRGRPPTRYVPVGLNWLQGAQWNAWLLLLSPRFLSCLAHHSVSRHGAPDDTERKRGTGQDQSCALPDLSPRPLSGAGFLPMVLFPPDTISSVSGLLLRFQHRWALSGTPGASPTGQETGGASPASESIGSLLLGECLTCSEC